MRAVSLTSQKHIRFQKSTLSPPSPIGRITRPPSHLAYPISCPILPIGWPQCIRILPSPSREWLSRQPWASMPPTPAKGQVPTTLPQCLSSLRRTSITWARHIRSHSCSRSRSRRSSRNSNINHNRSSNHSAASSAQGPSSRVPSVGSASCDAIASVLARSAKSRAVPASTRPTRTRPTCPRARTQRQLSRAGQPSATTRTALCPGWAARTAMLAPPDRQRRAIPPACRCLRSSPYAWSAWRSRSSCEAPAGPSSAAAGSSPHHQRQYGD